MTILFFIFELVVPGDFISSLALMYRGAQRASITRLLGLDAPVLQRYLLFMGNILRGNLGRSFGRFGPGPPVTAVLLNFLPATLLVFGVASEWRPPRLEFLPNL